MQRTDGDTNVCFLLFTVVRNGFRYDFTYHDRVLRVRKRFIRVDAFFFASFVLVIRPRGKYDLGTTMLHNIGTNPATSASLREGPPYFSRLCLLCTVRSVIIYQTSQHGRIRRARSCQHANASQDGRMHIRRARSFVPARYAREHMNIIPRTVRYQVQYCTT